MKFSISRDEAWPDYSLHEPNDNYPPGAIDIPDDKAAWIKATREEYDKTKDYLDEIFTKACEQWYLSNRHEKLD